MAKRKQPVAASETAYSDDITEFARVLSGHLQELGWNPDKMMRASTRYPLTKEAEDALKAKNLDKEQRITFAEGISRPQAYGILAKRSAGDWRPPSRGMINLIAHELAAHYEHAKSPRYRRENVEVLLEELLRAAGFASYHWVNDRWDEIIDAPRLEGTENEGEDSRLVRVGYFNWPGMSKLIEADGRVEHVQGPSAEIVKWLLRALRLPTAHVKVPLSVSDLYDRGLFMKVDLVAPLVGVPARRFAIGYSEPIGGWRVGQNILINTSHFNAFNQSKTVDSYDRLPNEKLQFCYLRGGVSELLVDELDIPPEARTPCTTFQDALDQVAVKPEEAEGRYPCFVGDSVTCHTAIQNSSLHLTALLKNEFTMACPLVFGLPQRPEVLATVNQALNLLETLRQREFKNLIPNGINRDAWSKHLNPKSKSETELES